MPVQFSTPTDASLRIRDAQQHRQFTLTSFDPIRPRQPSTDPFRVDADSSERTIDFAVEESRVFETSGLTIPERVSTRIRTQDGSDLGKLEYSTTQSFSEENYVLELSAPVKLFVGFSGAFDIVAGNTETRLFFHDATRVFVGGRSIQNTPTESVTVDESVASLYDLLSYFGQGLATTSPERSWPTLRGHPPAVQVGSRATVPDRASESGVRLHVPPHREFLYAAAPLAYYLDATVVRSSEPALTTTAGFTESLPAESALSFSRRIHELLQHQFTLDALTRTVGFYSTEIFEREQFERVHEPLDWPGLYELSLAERVGAYQEVPRAATAAVQPTWRTTATIAEDAEHVRSLPYLVNELPLVQPLETTTTRSREAAEANAAVSSFFRSATDRGPTEEPSTPSANRRYVSPPETDSLEDVWVGDGVPVKASKYLHAGYDTETVGRNQSSTITIQVVCNDAEMRHEVEDELYGGREELPFEVSTAFDTSVTELRDLIGTPTDFFHYIGHLDGEYFYCRDGRLDPASLDDVGVRGFLLNGCESYDQGLELVEAGATGGIVTLSRVADQSASRVGVMLARLLDQGFSIRASLEIARNHQGVGSQYVGIGNTSIALVQSETGIPAVAHIERAAEDRFSVEMCTYPGNAISLGSLYQPYLPRLSVSFLAGGETAPVLVTREELVEFLEQDYLLPTVFEDEFLWSPAVVERIANGE